MPLVEGELSRSFPPALAAWALSALHHAHWGVDLFFVLSGFSLAQGYLRAFAAGRAPQGARDFLTRRAARILPGYLVALAVVLAFHRTVWAHPSFGAALAAHLAVLQGYVAPGGLVFIGATWSLTTEISFYLLLPLLARPLLGTSRRAWVFGAALVVLAWTSRGLLHEVALHEADPGARFALLEATQRRWLTSRLDQFVLGALAARGVLAVDGSRFAARARRLAPFGLAAAIAALLLGFRLEGALYLEPGGSWPYAIVSLATAAIVLAACLCGDGARSVITAPPLAAIGVVSYGVFLYHQLALGLVGWAVPGEGGGALAVVGVLSLLLSVALGAASWVLVERPVMEAIAVRSRLRRGGRSETLPVGDLS